ncbi:hypothetical protein ATEIFO6365_0004005900 [Aspergillus terreus]|uniref:Uncharacterized protein n=1 Tax=Aspergillus terreus TaxID=33178 RepID=A0A5M3YNG2_ASPTE|nr:hypothetical protein ATETN484_0002015800 [Aspergillus terreus]GFF14941.1 hypothetical protein ATEIFO6365_0004005900 [Aspergillus terreus]
MPVQQMDALGAFTHLSDSIPQWIARLSELSAYTTARHAEYVEEFRKHSHMAPRPRRRKNSSVCSIHTDDLNLPPTDAQPKSNPRKRGLDQAPSVESADRHALVSTRHNVIIHYDGHTQKTLEEMVRHIGIARNHLRRGKMAQLPLAGFRTGLYSRTARIPNCSSTSLESDNSSPSPSPDLLLSNIRSSRQRGPPPAAHAPPKDSPFDVADKHLELAHSLCETAAHHFLRVGDCATELNGVDQKFKALLELAQKEVERLQAERKEEPQADEADLQPEPSKKPAPDNAQPSTAEQSDAIEVDDDDDGSMESLDLTVFRANRRRAYG